MLEKSLIFMLGPKRVSQFDITISCSSYEQHFPPTCCYYVCCCFRWHYCCHNTYSALVPISTCCCRCCHRRRRHSHRWLFVGITSYYQISQFSIHSLLYWVFCFLIPSMLVFVFIQWLKSSYVKAFSCWDDSRVKCNERRQRRLRHESGRQRINKCRP